MPWFCTNSDVRLAAIEGQLADALLSLHQIESKLDGLLAIITKAIGDTMSGLADLTAQVTANTTVEGSAVTLIQGLAAQIAAAVANSDDAALEALSGELSTSATALAAAITANTPSS